MDLPAHKEKVGKGWDEEGDWVTFQKNYIWIFPLIKRR